MNRNEVTSAPRFRIWPPMAVGGPWLVGYGLDRHYGVLALSEVLSHPVVRTAAWLLLGAFVLWNGWCLVMFGRQRTGLLPGQRTSMLLLTGPYRWSRNPLYVGLLACYVALAVLLVSPWALVLVPLAWGGLLWGAVLPEEHYLLEHFPDAYARYRVRVRRWL